MCPSKGGDRAPPPRGQLSLEPANAPDPRELDKGERTDASRTLRLQRWTQRTSTALSGSRCGVSKPLPSTGAGSEWTPLLALGTGAPLGSAEALQLTRCLKKHESHVALDRFIAKLS